MKDMLFESFWMMMDFDKQNAILKKQLAELKAENAALKAELEDANGESAYTRQLNLSLMSELGDYKRIIPDLLKHEKYKKILKDLREWLDKIDVYGIDHVLIQDVKNKLNELFGE